MNAISIDSVYVEYGFYILSRTIEVATPPFLQFLKMRLVGDLGKIGALRFIQIRNQSGGIME